MRQWSPKVWWWLLVGVAAVASLTTAYVMQQRTGIVFALVFLAGTGLGLRWLWLRSAQTRAQLQKMVNVPIRWTGQHKRPLALMGAGTVSLVGLYSLWGGTEEARAAVEQLVEASDTFSGADTALTIPEAAWTELALPVDGEILGMSETISEAVWLDEGMANETINGGTEATPLINDEHAIEQDPEASRVVGTYGAVLPVILVVSGLRSLWKHGNQVRQGRMDSKEALRAVGVDMVGTGGRLALFAGGAQVAGLLVGGTPLIIAGGVLANLAGDPLLRRMQAWLRGDQGTLAQAQVQQKLELVGRTFDKKQFLAKALLNLERFVTAAHRRHGLPEKPTRSLRQLLVPNLADILEEELFTLRSGEQLQLDEFADQLRDRLRDTQMREDYRALGELLYLNRQILLPGLETEMQRSIAQLDRALQRLAEKRSDKETSTDSPAPWILAGGNF